MIYLPNKFERYIASLRIYIQASIIKFGIKPKHIKQLKKIYIAEALVYSEFSIPVNLKYYLWNILTAVAFKKSQTYLPFNFDIKINKNYIVDIKPLTTLILSLASSTDKIYINEKNGYIVINVKTDLKKHNRKIIEKLNGCVLYEIKEKISLVLIPLTATNKQVLCNNFEMEDFILNPLSQMNVFI